MLYSFFFNAHSAYNFYVWVEGCMPVSFVECTLPDLTVDTSTQIKEGGQNAWQHTLPGQISVGNVTLKNGNAENMDLLNWYLLMLNGDVENATRNVEIMLRHAIGFPLVLWSFREAYPVKWTGPSMKAGDNSIAIESLEFAHRGIEVEVMDPAAMAGLRASLMAAGAAARALT